MVNVKYTLSTRNGVAGTCGVKRVLVEISIGALSIGQDDFVPMVREDWVAKARRVLETVRWGTWIC